MTEIKCSTIGVRPIIPVFFWDFDRTPYEQIINYANSVFEQFDIYLSDPINLKYHLVAKCDSYDEVQAKLLQCKATFPNEVYITHCRRLRLRITAKLDPNGKEILPAPKLIRCHCKHEHNEKRVGMTEVYYTKCQV